MLDPLADPEMRERAAKLLRLLASDAAGEAEAARAALLRLLARHGTSLDDLTQRLLGPAPDDSPALRAALAAAERRTAVAEAASSAALATAKRLRASIKLFRIVAVAASGAATLLLIFVFLPGGSGSGGGSVPVTVASVAAPPVATAPARSQPSQAVQSSPPTAASHDDHGMGTEAAAGRPPPTAARRGRVVAPEGVLLRLDPVPGVPSVALLPVGTKVVIDQAFPMLGTDWMQVRTPMGAGFVPASTIKPE
ncbi:MAG: hypothetical protein JO157_02160 [Acetobacteraceae bacterium]|nr:hypothetical protein [Acetobacteraceae bacterium]